MVLSTVDYAGGLIITDWYSENNPDEAIKFTVRFLANDVRVDSLKILIHKKTCKNSNCIIKQIDDYLSFDIKDRILRKAAQFVKLDKDRVKNKKTKSAIKNERSID